MKIHIKYMGSGGCIDAVKQILKTHEIIFESVEIGSVEVLQLIPADKLKSLRKSLLEHKFDLVLDNQEILVEKIKTLIIEMIYNDEQEVLNINFSDYLEGKIFLNYTYMSKRFNQLVGITIEKFIIATKVERIKSFLIFDDYSLTEISYKLNYSSVGHLSSQFKSLTGMTPTFFKEVQKQILNNDRN